MKNYKSIVFSSLIVVGLIFYACKKKDSKTCGDASAIKPSYKTECTGTGGNPNAGNATHTGSVPITNPASENSSLIAGGGGWLNPSCASTGGLILEGVNGSTKVTLQFSQSPTTGNYNVSNISGPTNVAVTVLNAPNQPSGIVWYGKTGVVSVTSSTNAINATFSGIQCVQSNFNFPVVTVSGQVGCN